MLRSLAEKSEKWSLFPDADSFGEARRIQVFLDDMSQCMHASDNPYNEVEEDPLSSHESVLSPSGQVSRRRMNRQYQRLLRNMGAHRVVLNLVKEISHVIHEVVERTVVEEGKEQQEEAQAAEDRAPVAEPPSFGQEEVEEEVADISGAGKLPSVAEGEEPPPSRQPPQGKVKKLSFASLHSDNVSQEDPPPSSSDRRPRETGPKRRGDGEMLAIFRGCMKFLKCFVSNSPKNKAKVAERLDLIERSITIRDLGQYDLLAELLRDNKQLIMIHGPRYIRLAARHLELHGRDPAPIQLLGAAIICEGVTLPRHQELVLEQLVSSPARAAAVIPCEEKDRIQIANQKLEPTITLHTVDVENGVLAYETAFVGLLASCCVRRPQRKGAKQHISTSICEAKCQQILSIDRAVRYAVEASTPQCLRMAVLRFLTWTYLCSEEAMRDTGSTHSGVYQLVEHMAVWASELAEDLDVAQEPGILCADHLELFLGATLPMCTVLFAHGHVVCSTRTMHQMIVGMFVEAWYQVLVARRNWLLHQIAAPPPPANPHTHDARLISALYDVLNAFFATTDRLQRYRPRLDPTLHASAVPEGEQLGSPRSQKRVTMARANSARKLEFIHGLISTHLPAVPESHIAASPLMLLTQVAETSQASANPRLQGGGRASLRESVSDWTEETRVCMRHVTHALMSRRGMRAAFERDYWAMIGAMRPRLHQALGGSHEGGSSSRQQFNQESSHESAAREGGEEQGTTAGSSLIASLVLTIRNLTTAEANQRGMSLISTLRHVASLGGESGEASLPDLQRLMAQQGVMELTMEILARGEGREGLFLAALELGIALLDGGNEAVQNQCCDILRVPGGHPFVRALMARITEGMASLESRIDDQGDTYPLPYPRGSRDQAHDMHEEETTWKGRLPDQGVPLLGTLSPVASGIEGVVGDTSRESTGHEEGGRAMWGIFRFLQLLCENHHATNQRMLRQPHGAARLDLVTLSVAYFEVVRRAIDRRTVDVAIQCLEAIAECLQGPCPGNQTAVVEAKFLDSAAAVLRQEYWEGVPVSKIKQLKDKCVEVLLAILEGIPKESPVPQLIADTITVRSLRDNLRWVLADFRALYPLELSSGDGGFSIDALPELASKRIPSPTVPRGEAMQAPPLVFEDPTHGDGSLGVGFKFYTLLRSLQDSIPGLEEEIDPNRRDPTAASRHGGGGERFPLFPQQGGRFERQWGAELDGNHTPSHAPGSHTPRGGHSLGGSSRGGEDRMSDWSFHRPELPAWPETHAFFAKHCKHVEVLRGSKLHRIYFPVLPMCTFITEEAKERVIAGLRRTTPESKVADLFTASLQLLQEMEYLANLDLQASKIHLKRILLNVKAIRDVVLLLVVLVNVVVLLSYRHQERRFYMDLPWYPDANIHLDQDQTKTLCDVLGVMLLGTLLIQSIVYLLTRGWLIIEEGWLRETEATNPKGSPIDHRRNAGARGARQRERRVTWSGWLQSCFYLVRDGMVSYFLFCLGCTLLALYTEPAYYAATLVTIFARSHRLRSVVQSVTRPYKTLILTLILYLIITYAFALVGYTSLSGDYPEGQCDTLMLCLRYTFDAGFKSDGGIGGQLAEISGTDLTNRGHLLGRLAFDNLFNILLLILLLNLIFGIIVDTFAELRTESDHQRHDMRNMCTVCSIDRNTLDRQTEAGFAGHISEEHNMWHYVYLMAYLFAKDPIHYTGHESYVAACIKAQETSFFPLRRAIELSESTLLEKPGGGEASDREQKGLSGVGKKEGSGSRSNSRSSSFALGASRGNLGGGGGGPFGISDLPGVQLSALSGRVGRLEHSMTAMLDGITALQQDVRKACGINPSSPESGATTQRGRAPSIGSHLAGVSPISPQTGGALAHLAGLRPLTARGPTGGGGAGGLSRAQSDPAGFGRGGDDDGAV